MTETQIANWKKAIVHSIDLLEINGWDKANNSKTYDLRFGNGKYPPKEVFRNAAIFIKKHFPEMEIPTLRGGTETNEFIKELGFEIGEKMEAISSLVIDLKKHFPRIWRCADSLKWNVLKDSDLLTINWLDARVDYSKVDWKTVKNGKTAMQPWTTKLKKGDLIFVMGKNSFNGIAIADSEYDYAGPFIDFGPNNLKPAVRVNYIYKREKPINHGLSTHNNPTSFAKIDQYRFGLIEVLEALSKKVPDAIDALYEYLGDANFTSEKSLTPTTKMKHSLNQILFGPPGTGKTFNTVGKALEILGEDTKGLARKEIKKIFEKKVDEKQIVFTTFHQSMSYEDFIEGIKPETINGRISYSVVPGIFLDICERASLKSKSNFEEVISRFQKDLGELGSKHIEWGRTKFEVLYRGGKTFKINPESSANDNPEYPASIENIRKLYQGIPDDGMYNPSYVRGILNHLYHEYNLVRYDQIVETNDKNYVLIIDEINRGNVSGIFGELITLIEENKRLGKEEELKVKLTYSKSEIGVPANLHIIGTMNTADRSIEALDTALRRRFTFVEMMPNPKLLENKSVGGISLEALLTTLNQRIEALLDRDHTIGHSYLFDVSTPQDLANAFNNCIIPLLREYFYNDLDKIGLILGEDFFDDAKEDKVLFAKFDSIAAPQVQKPRFLKKLDGENITDALKTMLAV